MPASSVLLLTSCIIGTIQIRSPFVGLNPPRYIYGAPPLPFENPNILGVSFQRARAIESLEGALACLESGNAVYGMTLENSNVRDEPDVDACRIGRTPRGRLIRINGIFAENSAEPLTSLLDTAESDEDAEQEDGIVFSFEGDVKPIFDRNCNSCHGSVIKTVGLQVTDFQALMAGSDKGEVLVPGDASASKLWTQVDSGKMPLVGELSDEDKTIIKAWIDGGAIETRPALPRLSQTWLLLNREDVDDVPIVCDHEIESPKTLVSSTLVQFLSCGVEPPSEFVTTLKEEIEARPREESSIAGSGNSGNQATQNTSGAQAYAAGSGGRIQAGSLGLPPPSDSDPFLIPQGGFCIEQRLARRLQDQRSITALAFAPNGTLFMALDTMPTGQDVDPLVLLDAYHPSRSIAAYNSIDDGGFGEIFVESSRITGLAHEAGNLYVSRAGEVGRIPDGGSYQKLAGGFAVNSQLFHANNGIAISNGWLYVSAGGIRDGWSDGPLVNMDEAGAMHIVSGGNRLAARLVRAPLDQLLSQRSIDLFQTAARGLRNPYGLTRGPDGRLWITDNGATNVPEGISAGDEVNVFDPNSVAPGTAEEATPFYGFPLALTGHNPDWYVQPVVAMPNTAAPTGITWAYGTIFYAQYGRDPGLYRLGRASNGQTIAERIMLAWPVISLATAPDGALWMGTGTGGLYRLTPGCG